MDASDWRAQLQPETRKQTSNKVISTFKTCHPFSDEDELLELQKIAQSFEEKTYAGAISMSDYLQKIDFKMHIMKEASDWRVQLRPDSRNRIVNKIMDTLKKHLPVSGPEGLLEMRRIAQRFEEKIFNAATSQSGYLRIISLKMLTMETKSQGPCPMGNNLPLNPVGPSNKPSDTTADTNLRKQSNRSKRRPTWTRDYLMD